MTDSRFWAPSPPGVIPARQWARMCVEQLEDALRPDPGIYQRSLTYWAWRPLLTTTPTEEP